MQTKPADETELTIRAQRGDVPAYEELVRRYQELAFRVAYVVTHDAETAKDAAQSGFIKAFYALPRYRAGTPFRPWLLKIVSNEARNQIRAQGRRETHELRLAAACDRASPSAEKVTIVGLSRERLLEAVNALGERDREVIVFRFFLDLSEAEMAAALDCRRGTVKSRLSRALGRLREVLDDMNVGVEG